MTGTIKSIDHLGEWEHQSGTMQTYNVRFADDKQYKFNAKGEFKKNIGDTIEYEVVNEKYKNAKIVYPKPQAKGNYQSGGTRSADTQTQIVRQSMIKASIDYNAMIAGITGEPISLDQVKQTARELINFIETGN